jgi:actin-related protein 6
MNFPRTFVALVSEPSLLASELSSDGQSGPSLVSYSDQGLLDSDDRNVSHGALPAECVLVIDSGYSHTTVTPVYKGRPLYPAIRRLEIGGRFMTNYLKELVSIRSYNMMDETYTIDKMKEDISFVSDNFSEDLERTWKGGKGDKRPPAITRDWNEATCRGDILVETGRRGIVVDYVLPDYDKFKAGYIRPHDPIQAKKLQKLALSGKGQDTEAFITVGNERFVVPELLLTPGDIGTNQAGIPELITESLYQLPEGIRPAMLANIVAVGGNSNIEGFVERLY